MKTKALFVVGLILCRLCLVAAAQSETPELRGILFVGGEKKFNLSNATGTENAWVEIGGTYGGWRLVSFDPKEEILVLSQGEKQISVRLANSKVQEAEAKKGTPATLADAEEVMRKMNLDQMIDRIMEQQKKMGVQMSKQMVSRLGASAAQSEEMAALQTKVLEALFPKESIDQMKKDITRIYSEVFTREELQELSKFYGTELGRSMVEKQPLIQQKTSEAMMPQIQQNMVKVQGIMKEYAAEMKARKDAQKAAQPNAPTGGNP